MKLKSEKVYLRAMDPEKDSATYARWQRDALYDRFMDSEIAMMFTPDQMKTWFEKRLDTLTEMVIVRKSDDQMIGFIELAGYDWHSGNAWLGIGIGERENWGKGYGSEALRLLLRMAFLEWNLHRVSLAVLGYNERAKRSYEKVGFKVEGTLRGFVYRDGKRWDMYMMGVLREEWDALQADPDKNKG